MRFRVQFVSLLCGGLMLAAVACSSNTAAPTTNPGQSAPTLAPAASNPTSAPAASAPTSAPTLANPSPAAPSPTAAASTTSAGAAAPSGNPLDLILNAEQARLKQPTRATIVTTDSAKPNQSHTITIEFQPPDRIHEILPGQEFISIRGQGTWMKLNGKWQKSPVDLGAAAFDTFSPKVIEELRKDIQVSQTQFVGPDILSGKPMFVYTYVTTIKGTQGNPDYTTTSKIWIGATDQLPYQVESDGPSVVTKGATTHTVITYDYNANLKIEAPG